MIPPRLIASAQRTPIRTRGEGTPHGVSADPDVGDAQDQRADADEGDLPQEVPGPFAGQRRSECFAARLAGFRGEEVRTLVVDVDPGEHEPGSQRTVEGHRGRQRLTEQVEQPGPRQAERRTGRADLDGPSESRDALGGCHPRPEGDGGRAQREGAGDDPDHPGRTRGQHRLDLPGRASFHDLIVISGFTVGLGRRVL